MDNHEIDESTNDTNYLRLARSESQVSELIRAYLEHVRVEHGRARVTIERYRARLQRFITQMGDCRVEEITPDDKYLYREKDVLDDEERWHNMIGGTRKSKRVPSTF